MVIAAERTRDPKQPKRFEKNKNIDSRGVSQLQDSAQMANRFHGPLPILSWRRNNQPAFIRSKEDETNYHNWSNTFLFDQASPRDARRYAALVVGSWSGLVVVSPWLTIPVASIHILTASPKLAATRSAFAPSRNCSSAEESTSFSQQPRIIVACGNLRRRRRTEYRMCDGLRASI